MLLRRLILILALGSMLVPFAIMLTAGYLAQRKLLVQVTLQSNLAYSHKLATSTEDFLQSAQRQLGVTATIISTHMHDKRLLDEETSRLRSLNASFNSIAIIGSDGKVVSAAPGNARVEGQTMGSKVVRDTLALRRPMISEPYVSAAGNYIIFITHPIFNQRGEMEGLVGGAIFLQHQNVLHRLLGTHFYSDGSYLYVVDKSRRILYHPNLSRVGEVVHGNPAIEQVIQGRTGAAEITNSVGTRMLAGYTPVPSTGWGIIAQRPSAQALAPVYQSLRHTLLASLPLIALMAIITLVSAHLIARPLQLLAQRARSLDLSSSRIQIDAVNAWYFEAKELKAAMLAGMQATEKRITQLNDDVATDVLTQLGNRRRLEGEINRLVESGTAFCVISADVDNFKSVNDTHGHAAGDEVLRIIADTLRGSVRPTDIPCRPGGEEFTILLPETELAVAHDVAERIRLAVMNIRATPLPAVTLSLGVAHWPESSPDVKTVLRMADSLLYAAKREGRNRVRSATPLQAP